MLGLAVVGRGPFGVRVNKFSRDDAFFSVVTLKGHPLSGYRLWRIVQLPNGDMVIETTSVEHDRTLGEGLLALLARANSIIDRAWHSTLMDVLEQAGPNASVNEDSVFHSPHGSSGNARKAYYAGLVQ